MHFKSILKKKKKIQASSLVLICFHPLGFTSSGASLYIFQQAIGGVCLCSWPKSQASQPNEGLHCCLSVTSSLKPSSTHGSWLSRQSCSQQVEMPLHTFVFPCNHTWEFWQCPEPPCLGTAFPHTILDLRMYGKTPQNMALMFLLPPVRFCQVSSKTRQSNNCLHLFNL